MKSEKVEGVDNLFHNKNRRSRGIGISKKMAVGIVAVMIAMTLIASGAIISYYGRIETKVTVLQSVRLDGMTYNSAGGGYNDIIITNDIPGGNLVASCCVWGGCHNLHLHSQACDTVSVELSSVVSPNDGGLTTMIAADIKDAGATIPTYVPPTSWDILVDPSGTYKTITAGIAVAVTGDVVCVKPWNYNLAWGETFPITINNDITLVSLEGPGTTFITVSSGKAIVLNSPATIKGFTINGQTTASDGIYISPGISGTSASPGVIEGNEIYGFTNIGVHIASGGSAYWEIKGNYMHDVLGCIYFNPAKNILVSNNIFENYGAACGGTEDTKDITITHNTFLGGDKAPWEGIGLAVGGSSYQSTENLVITYNSFEADEAGIRTYYPGPVGTGVSVTNNNFEGDSSIDATSLTGTTLSALNNWWGCDGIDISGNVNATWYTWSDGNTITLQPDETRHFMIQYCTLDNAVGKYTSTVTFLPHP